jgi:hypothetical protein
MVRSRNLPPQSRERSDGTFLVSLPASHSPASVLPSVLSRRLSKPFQPSGCKLSAVSYKPPSSSLVAARAAFGTVFCKSPYQFHSMALTPPLFSYSYGLFCTSQNAISNLFCIFRTLCGKHPGGGGGLLSPRVSVESVNGSRPCDLLFLAKPFTIRTPAKRAPNSFGMRTSKTQNLNSFGIRTYQKSGEGVSYEL